MKTPFAFTPMHPLFCISLIILSLGVVGCASHQTSFQDYGTAVETGKLPAHLMAAPQVSDGLAINYANSVEHAMRLKFTGARITREVSNTTQVALAAFGGAAAAFEYSASTVAALSLGSAGIPELQRIFNARGRAEVFKDAAQTIRRAILEYYSHNPQPSSTDFTPNGLVLVQRVSVAIDMVDDVLAGHMPSQTEMLDAVEPMTPAGTEPHEPGTVPVNNISADPSARARLVKSAPAVLDQKPPGLDTRATTTEFSARRRMLGSMVVVMRKQGNGTKAAQILAAGGVFATEATALSKLGGIVDDISTKDELQRWERAFGLSASGLVKTPPVDVPQPIENLSGENDDKPPKPIPKATPAVVDDPDKVQPFGD